MLIYPAFYAIFRSVEHIFLPLPYGEESANIVLHSDEAKCLYASEAFRIYLSSNEVFSLLFRPFISFLHLLCIVPALLYGGETKSFAKVLGSWARKAMCWMLGKDV